MVGLCIEQFLVAFLEKPGQKKALDEVILSQFSSVFQSNMESC